MLDNITKKNIDDCRDVLVGKVPDPKSQIEQITIALIYKFMDDMDKESVEKFKGKAKFFTDDFAKYGWRKLFDPSLNGKDMLDLYSDALDKLQNNSKIPELFRNIFKNAYLPYRDPSTLKMFLKYINEFEYSHSEKLGDAFEYLLMVMGSQGDAGQFRTPRHIIDFIVACLNPQKNETVCDPACGTAGFLLSAYKHILNQNTDKRLGDKLTPDQRKKLTTNFVGYDISPDMVRLSLVNMYLHLFTAPNIYEYDTLSSEERWDETFDVILANPPFMTPKGGIQPHKKFGVQANKAEVLFTDYIGEHLNKNGRAGIVVPNGIVATTQTAYKQLRKMLVNDSLIAVVSLPAGCFNPYSGVKTSILMLDKPLAKKTNHILFIKVANDGLDLGVQRREIDKNDLPLALEAFNAYKESINSGIAFDKVKYNSICLLVEKEKILANKEIQLSGDRYQESKNSITENSWGKIEEVAELFTDGDWIESKDQSPSGIRLLQTGNVGIGEYKNKATKARYISEATFRRLNCTEIFEGDVLVSRLPDPVGRACIVPHLKERIITAVDCTIIRFDKTKILPQLFVAYSKCDEYYKQLKNFISGASRDRISRKNLGQIEIPIPPLDIQKQIVSEIEGYQKIIDGAKMVVENYKPTISIKPEWEIVELGTLAKLVGGSTPSKANSSYWENGNVDWITCSDFSNSPMYIEDSIRKITEKAVKENSTIIVPKDTLVLVTRVSLGKLAFVSKPTALNQDLTALLFEEDKINKSYGYFFLLSIADKIERDGHGATVKGVSRDYVKDIKIPLPSLEEQEIIVKAIEEEIQFVNSNKRLIVIFEQKIKDKINEVWGTPNK